jgi:hypothetical protein
MSPEQETILRSIGVALKGTRDDLRTENAASQRAVLEAVGKTLQGVLPKIVADAVRLATEEARRVAATALKPDVHVTNEVQTNPSPIHVDAHVQPTPISVNLDMGPVADAVARILPVIEQILAAITELAKTMSIVPTPVVRSTVNVPETSVIVHPPQVTVEQPARPKRKIKILHSDGTESTLYEE